MPGHLFKNPKYLEIMAKKFPETNHILDCPDSNLPALTKSKANNYTDRIKMICPRIFPTSFGQESSLENLLNTEIDQ